MMHMMMFMPKEEQTPFCIFEERLLLIEAQVSQTAAGRGDAFGIGSGACSPPRRHIFCDLSPAPCGAFLLRY